MAKPFKWKVELPGKGSGCISVLEDFVLLMKWHLLYSCILRHEFNHSGACQYKGLYLFENLHCIDNVAIFSSRKEGVRLARDYGMQVVAKGKNNEHHFTWHGMLSPVEDILFSDTVLRLFF